MIKGSGDEEIFTPLFLKQTTMQKKIILFLLFCLACSINVLAQHKVKVTVVEKGTRHPLAGALVSFSTNKELTHAVKAVTDTDGKALLHLETGDMPHYFL